jgi:hypothetical protein
MTTDLIAVVCLIGILFVLVLAAVSDNVNL